MQQEFVAVLQISHIDQNGTGPIDLRSQLEGKAFNLFEGAFVGGCNPSSAYIGSGWCLSGGSAAWVPSSSLHGGIYGFP
jgi:hypothetical protein